MSYDIECTGDCWHCPYTSECPLADAQFDNEACVCTDNEEVDNGACVYTDDEEIDILLGTVEAITTEAETLLELKYKLTELLINEGYYDFRE